MKLRTWSVRIGSVAMAFCLALAAAEGVLASPSSPLATFRVPAHAPYHVDELIKAAKLGNTPAGVAAMSRASAKVTAAARAAVMGDGLGGVTKQTVSADIAAYFFRIAGNDPAAAVELARAIAPGTGLRRSLQPSPAVAATLRQMESAAQRRLASAARKAASVSPPLPRLRPRPGDMRLTKQ
jgi:hypothetical protein